MLPNARHSRPRTTLSRALLVAALAVAGGCTTTGAPAGRDDAAAVLRLSHAEDRFNVAMREFTQRQVERNPELKPFRAAIDDFWREQLPWAGIRDRLLDRYAGLYTPDELHAIRRALERPYGDRVAGHAEVLDRELGEQAIKAVQDRLPALEEHLRAMHNAVAAGQPGELTAEEDFIAVQARAAEGDAAAQLLVAEKLFAGAGTARDIPQAIDWLEKSAAQDHAPALDTLAALYYRGSGVPRDYRRARDLMARAVARQYLPAINDLAWLLATCPDDSLRDGKRAVALLSPVIDQSPQMLDTLAAAHAENGNFTEAIALQKHAIAGIGNTADPRFAAAIERLLAYAAGQPWRDPPAARRPGNE